MGKELVFRLGDSYSVIREVTDEMVKGFAKHSNDLNPVHLDDEYASNTIFKKRIAHGFLIGSFISAVLGNDFPGEGTIYLSQNMIFKAPVYLDDKIKVIVEIVEFPRGKRIKLLTKCYNQKEQEVLSGEAVVLPPLGSKLVI